MTSQSPKKHRTTRPSTARANRLSSGKQRNRTKRGQVVVTSLLFAGLLPSVVLATEPIDQPAQTQTSGQSQASGQSQPSSRFDPASAEARWEKLRAAYLGRSRKPQLIPTKAEAPKTSSQPALPSVRWEQLEEAQVLSLDETAAAPVVTTPGEAATEQAEAPAVTTMSPQADFSAFDDPKYSTAVQSADFTSTATAAVRPTSADPSDLYQPPAITESADVANDSKPYFTPTFEDAAEAENRGWSDAPIDLSGNDDAYLTPIPMVAAQEDFAKASPGMDISDRLTLKPLSSIVPSADYSPTAEDACQYICPTPEGCPDNIAGACPTEVPLPTTRSADRFFGESMTHWTASNLCYNPLYFEDPSLERYGQHIVEPVQSIKSVGLFAAQFVSLPYLMALDPAHSGVSPLGFYRPGEAAPHLKRAIPLNKKAAATSIGAYTGLIFLIP